MAHGQQGIIALGSAAIKHGKPAPNAVNILSVTINPTRNSTTNPHEFLHIDILGETTIQSYVTTVTTTGTATSEFMNQEDPQQAKDLFHNFEGDTYQDLGYIANGAGFGP